MAKLSILPEVVADPLLASDAPEQQSSDCPFTPSDMFLSSGQSGSGLLPSLRPIRVRAM
jgi:hypothetical protein